MGKNKKTPNMERGRPKMIGKTSRDKYKCKVPSCGHVTRSDNLKLHYKAMVKCDSSGKPLSETSLEFKSLKIEGERKHTLYFQKHGYNFTNLPPRELTDVPISNNVNPFTLASLSRTGSEPLIESDSEMLTDGQQNTDSDEEITDINPISEIAESNALLEMNTTELPGDKAELVGSINDSQPDPTTSAQFINIDMTADDANRASDCDHDKSQTHSLTQSHIGCTESITGNDDSKTNVSSNLCSNLVTGILEKIEERFGATLDQDAFAQIVADKVLIALKSEEQEPTSDIETKANWIYGSDNNTCRDCLIYATHQDLPTKLKANRKGDFAVFSRKAEAKETKRRMKLHIETDLHIWCHKFALEQEQLNTKFQEENKDACTIQVTNALFCLKTCGSSADFVKENDKDVINYNTSHQQGSKPPTKNDGVMEFFDIREKAFTLLTDNIRSKFKQVKSIAVTLDKVTCGHHPYTVIITYFFWEGRIRVVLNRVQPMTPDWYDGAGSANMVIETLRDTLKMSREDLARKCHHFAYDGVYATEEERLFGGGLKLVHHFATSLGLEAGDVTGNWDMSHLMQLAYGDLLKVKSATYSPYLAGMIKDIFDLMSDFNSGKAALQFHTYAEQLNYSVLTNKRNQTTRFVRALLRGLQTLLRNIPCLYGINGKVALEAAAQEKPYNTTAKAALNRQKKIADGKFIACVVGIAQILEEYALTSLDSQNSSFFPTSVLNSADVHMGNIKTLGEEWSWTSTNPKLASIGAPKDLINNLLAGNYTPYVTPEAIKKAQIKSMITRGFKNQVTLDIAEEQQQQTEIEEALTWETPIPHDEYGAGSIPIVDFTEEDLQSVEEQLSSVASAIYQRYSTRFTESPLLEAAKRAFTISNDDDQEDEIDYEDMLSEVITSIPGPSRDQFDVDTTLPGYKLFV